jgi:glycosyltransferase involved in cell wall biosynthesis
MKIIIVTSAAPHPFADTAARWSFVLIKELLARGHRVTCFCATGESQQRIADAETLLYAGEDARALKVRFFELGYQGNALVRRLLSLQRPFSEAYYAPELHGSLRREMADGYDVLHLEQLWTGWFGTYPRSILNVHHFEIIDHARPALSNLREWKVFKQMERATERILKGNSRIRVFSERLLDKAKTINPSARYFVVPFALDLSHYPILPAIDEPVAGLIGSMHWLPSRSAAERLLTRIWPLVRAEIPAARLIVAGWNARNYLGKFASTAGVEILDSIPHPSEFFSRIAALIYPVQRGSGMKVKVMESMAYGVPVVTTPDGVEGLNGHSEVDYIVGETDETIAAATVRLLRTPSLRAGIRHAGRGLIEREYSRNVVVTQLMKIYKEMIA